MKIGFSEINGFKIKGKDLKKLIFSSSGILVFEGRQLTFVSIPEMKMTTYRPTSDKSITKEVFISKEFNKIKELDDEETYLVTVCRGIMLIRKRDIYGDSVIIVGESL